MSHNIKYGKIGEKIAKKYLISRGYSIIQSNYRLGNDEVDILANYNKYLVFIEIKTRLSNSFGLAEDQLTMRKKHNIYRSLRYFYLTYGINEHQLKTEFIAVNLNITEKIANIKHFKSII